MYVLNLIHTHKKRSNDVGASYFSGRATTAAPTAVVDTATRARLAALGPPSDPSVSSLLPLEEPLP